LISFSTSSESVGVESFRIVPDIRVVVKIVDVDVDQGILRNKDVVQGDISSSMSRSDQRNNGAVNAQSFLDDLVKIDEFLGLLSGWQHIPLFFTIGAKDTGDFLTGLFLDFRMFGQIVDGGRERKGSGVVTS
jgi:hypothetical protein